MKALTPRQEEIVARIKADGKLNPDKLSPKKWLMAKRNGVRLADLTKLLGTSTETLYALFRHYGVDRPKKEGRVVKPGYINRDLEETRQLLDLVRKGGERAQTARRKLLNKGIRYYTAEEAEELGLQ